jgi:hypothetical protein
MQFTEGYVKTYQASIAIAQYLRVKLTAGLLVLAVAADKELGTTERPSFGTAGEDVPVRLRTAPGTAIFIANAAIARGAEVFAAAGGKVAPAGTVAIGTAESAAGADGDQIEVLRY